MMTSLSAAATIKGSTAGGADSPERERGFPADPLALVAEQGDQVGNGGFCVGADPPQAHDDFGTHTLLSLLQQAAQSLDGRFADGRQRQGRTVILVRLFLPWPPIVVRNVWTSAGTADAASWPSAVTVSSTARRT